MAGKETVNLTKLGGTNYQTWKFGISFLLDSRELSDFADGTDVELSQDTKIVKWKIWKKSKSQAAVILLSSVDQALHPNMMNCRSPKDIWNKLKGLYGETNEDTITNAWQQFYDFKIVDSEPVNIQIEKFESLFKKLQNADENISEKAIISNC